MADRLPNAGDLRHRLTLQSPAVAQDDSGQAVSTWTTIGTYWAKVENLTGMELMNARQIKSTISNKITMRVVGTVRPSYRFLFESTGRIFNIDAVYRADEINAYYAIHCTEQFGSS